MSPVANNIAVVICELIRFEFYWGGLDLHMGRGGGGGS